MGCFLRLPLINRMPAYGGGFNRSAQHLLIDADREVSAWKGQLKSTVRYLGIEVDDALSLSEQVDIW